MLSRYGKEQSVTGHHKTKLLCIFCLQESDRQDGVDERGRGETMTDDRYCCEGMLPQHVTLNTSMVQISWRLVQNHLSEDTQRTTQQWVCPVWAEKIKTV